MHHTKQRVAPNSTIQFTFQFVTHFRLEQRQFTSQCHERAYKSWLWLRDVLRVAKYMFVCEFFCTSRLALTPHWAPHKVPQKKNNHNSRHSVDYPWAELSRASAVSPRRKLQTVRSRCNSIGVPDRDIGNRFAHFTTHDAITSTTHTMRGFAHLSAFWKMEHHIAAGFTIRRITCKYLYTCLYYIKPTYFDWSLHRCQVGDLAFDLKSVVYWTMICYFLYSLVLFHFEQLKSNTYI